MNRTSPLEVEAEDTIVVGAGTDLAAVVTQLPIAVELYAPDHRRVFANAAAERMRLPEVDPDTLSRVLAGERLERPAQWADEREARGTARESWQPVPGGEGALAMRVVEEASAEPASSPVDVATLQFHALADILPHFVWTARPDGTIDFMSRTGCEYAGLEPGEGLNWGWMSVMHPEDLQPTMEAMQQSLMTGQPFVLKNRFRRVADGMYRWHLSQCVPVRGPAGDVIRWLGTSTDIHDQKREAEAQAMLARVSNSLAATLDYERELGDVADLIVHHVADWCVIDLLQGDGRLHRLAAAAADPERLASLRLPEGYASDELEVVAAALRSATPEVRERPGPSGPQSVTELCVPLVARGHSFGVLLLQADARRFGESDRRLVEDLCGRVALAMDNTRLYREASEASRLKDEFLAIISHELRTPLNAILGWAQVLRASRNPAQLQHGLTVIERNATLQTSLIEDLLDIATIVAGKVRLEPQSVRLQEVAANAVESQRPSAEQKGLELTFEVEGELGPVSGDGARLQQVIWNLVANAIKFTPRGGRVAVKAAAVGAEARVSVADSGQGIAPEFLPYVFDRFRQGEGSESRRYGGLGLGLSIVRHLMELHGGRVWAWSAGPGQGAVFSIALPVPERSDAGRDAREPPPQGVPEVDSLRGLTVLVVDDEPSARELLRLMLGAAGARVLEASSAGEALALVAGEQLHLDLVLSDIGMPGDDGYAFIRKLRGLPRYARTPAAALTAYAREQDAAKALTEGYQAHLPKPIDRNRLVATVQRLGRAGEARGW